MPDGAFETSASMVLSLSPVRARYLLVLKGSFIKGMVLSSLSLRLHRLPRLGLTCGQGREPLGLKKICLGKKVEVLAE